MLVVGRTCVPLRVPRTEQCVLFKFSHDVSKLAIYLWGVNNTLLNRRETQRAAALFIVFVLIHPGI